eukprot:TRINITY_DN2460_c0_g2_i1.p1 TRINITY_DN2460_c0_g2~~TRINITY_DN2460_c0_g2_i1.p1  ORF type:complete len:646 (+),score=66.30 TRINITY_DN2460_c0_g2_i1:162-2099(+)
MTAHVCPRRRLSAAEPSPSRTCLLHLSAKALSATLIAIVTLPSADAVPISNPDLGKPSTVADLAKTNKPAISPENYDGEEDLISRQTVLPLGIVEGRPCSGNRGVTVYYGIPFAEPPLHANRYRAPVPKTTAYENGRLNCTSKKAPCGSYKQQVTKDRIVSSEVIVSSEDCLFMNIWVPAAAALGQSTVAVHAYIHGGDLTESSASNPMWDGCVAAAKGSMIQVNIQFRLGPFGMFAHPITMEESNSTGNWGLMDIQLALQWIQDHIAKFGGDPTKVMLDGNSRGGQMVEFLMVTPKSEGLFSSAVSQSPPCAFFRTLEQAYEDSIEFMKAVKCFNEGSPESEMECMRTLDWGFIMNTTRNMQNGRPLDILWCDQVDWKPTFHHVVDGTLVPYQMLDALERGAYMKVPYMTGITTAEDGYFVLTKYTTEANMSTVYTWIETIFPNADPDVLLDLYNAEYFRGAPAPILAQFQAMWTDTFFTCPTHRRLNARMNSLGQRLAPTFFYWWGVNPSCPPEYTYLGPFHGSNLWFEFGMTENFATDMTESGLCNYNKAEVDLSWEAVFSLKSMAETGAPRWTNGTMWVEWDPVHELGTYLNADQYETKQLNFAPHCTALLEAVQKKAPNTKAKVVEVAATLTSSRRLMST